MLSPAPVFPGLEATISHADATVLTIGQRLVVFGVEHDHRELPVVGTACCVRELRNEAVLVQGEARVARLDVPMPGQVRARVLNDAGESDDVTVRRLIEAAEAMALAQRDLPFQAPFPVRPPGREPGPAARVETTGPRSARTRFPTQPRGGKAPRAATRRSRSLAPQTSDVRDLQTASEPVGVTNRPGPPTGDARAGGRRWRRGRYFSDFIQAMREFMSSSWMRPWKVGIIGTNPATTLSAGLNSDSLM